MMGCSYFLVSARKYAKKRADDIRPYEGIRIATGASALAMTQVWQIVQAIECCVILSVVLRAAKLK